MSCGCELSLKLCLPVGTSPIWGFTVTDPDSMDSVVSISGATFDMFVKESEDDADEDAVYSLTSDNGEIVIISASGGTAQIINDAEKTALLTTGVFYYWSLRVTFSGGETRVIRNGKLFAESP